MTGGSLRIKRVYEPAEAEDGLRVLVDRLWPRGLSRERAALDLWLKDVAPSPGLRVWWGHAPATFAGFADRYRAELAANPAVAELEDAIDAHPVTTLLFAAHDQRINHAAVLRDYLEADAR